MKREKPVEKSAEDAAREAAERKAAVPAQSLEDRQKQYRQARARIFGSDEDHDFSDPEEEVAGATTATLLHLWSCTRSALFFRSHFPRFLISKCSILKKNLGTFCKKLQVLKKLRNFVKLKNFS